MANFKMTPEKVKELEWYFMLGLTDEEACLLWDLSRETMNKYCQAHEKWREKKETLKRKPIIQAKKNIIEKLNWQDYDASKWYLERKAKDEFSLKQEIDTKHSWEITLWGILSDLWNDWVDLTK